MADDGRAREGVRQHNLGRVLRRVHLVGPQSRAQLTEATGLNRSTIADLVTSLTSAGLVQEQQPATAGRVGRPSPVVSVAPGPVVIAANPEVDAIEIAAVGLDHTLQQRARIVVDASLSPERTATLLADQIEQWRAGPLADSDILAVGIAVPGLVRATDGVVRDAPHLRWTDAPLGDLVRAATGLPTTIGNDASLGVLAEHLYGAAIGIDDVVYLNGGASGIGGGLIIGGAPVGGASGYAGEFGQNRPGIAAVADRLAPNGVLEDEVSRARLLEVCQLTGGDDSELARALGARTSVDIEGETSRQRRILATALANAVNVLNPEMIVLGGFLTALAELDLPGFELMVRRQSMPASAENLVITMAALADERLLIGAAEVAFASRIDDLIARR